MLAYCKNFERHLAEYFFKRDNNLHEGHNDSTASGTLAWHAADSGSISQSTYIPQSAAQCDL